MQLRKYMVLYRVESIMCPTDQPFGFECCAEDTGHAEEQCTNAYPDCDVVWVTEEMDYLASLQNYYNEGLDTL